MSADRSHKFSRLSTRNLTVWSGAIFPGVTSVSNLVVASGGQLNAPNIAGRPTLSNAGSSAANQYYGTLAVTSVAAPISYVISTTAITANPLVTLTLRALAITGASTDIAMPPFIVRSVSAGGSFVVGPMSWAVLVSSYQLSWLIANPT